MLIRSTASAPKPRGLLLLCLLVSAAGAGAAPAAETAKKLKVFIMAGQSNMEGYAQIATFDYIGDDPATAPLLKTMRGADGKPAVCGHTWISYRSALGDKDFVLDGPLTAGYGSMWGVSPTKPGDKIGPEFTFGLTMDAAIEEPVLIIKTAWGGKSLHTDFRPPGAGPYQMSSFEAENYPKQTGQGGIPPDFEQWKAEKAKATGRYYRLMVEHVKKVLADLKQVVPGYDAAQGYELSGFVWFQGWNDLVDGHVYPDRNSRPDGYDLYSKLLAQFIRDVRKDLDAPAMPFVIGVLGIEGVKTQRPAILTFRRAMAAPAALPEFQGNVVAVETAPFWSDELGAIDYKRSERQPISPAEESLWKRGASNAGYHYLGCAKTFAQMGKAFAEALLPFQE